MIARRGPSSGRALPREMRKTAPILHRVLSERVSKGNRVRGGSIRCAKPAC